MQAISHSCSPQWLTQRLYTLTQTSAHLPPSALQLIEQLETTGFAVLPQLLNPQNVQNITEALDTYEDENLRLLYKNRRSDGTFPRLIALHNDVPTIEALFSHETIRNLQHLLLGYLTPLRTSIAFLQGSQQPLHRDIPIFNTQHPSFYFRVLIALEPHNAQNGAFFALPYSHRIAANPWNTPRQFYTKQTDIPPINQDRFNAYQEKLAQQYVQAGLHEKRFELQAGDALIWHPLLAHGGETITDKHASRKSIVLHFSSFN